MRSTLFGYTYNHYEDFQEYLNYEGGWGKIFGYNQRPAGSSKPSPYIAVAYASFASEARVSRVIYLKPFFIEKRKAA